MHIICNLLQIYMAKQIQHIPYMFLRGALTSPQLRGVAAPFGTEFILNPLGEVAICVC